MSPRRAVHRLKSEKRIMVPHPKAMTRVIERRQAAALGETVLELRLFRTKAAEVRAYITCDDAIIDTNMMMLLSRPAAEAFLDALALCEREGVANLWVHDTVVRRSCTRAGYIWRSATTPASFMGPTSRPIWRPSRRGVFQSSMCWGLWLGRVTAIASTGSTRAHPSPGRLSLVLELERP
jgi:hypothetical protein